MPANVARGILEPHVRIVTTLMVDLLGIGVLRPNSNDAPIFFDVMHTLQMRDAAARASGGWRLAKPGSGTLVVQASLLGWRISSLKCIPKLQTA
jgi:hypothetical protein